MNLQDKVSTIMTSPVKTLGPKENLQAAKDLFEGHSVHHIPVVEEEKLLGILSKTDYLYFLKPTHPDSQEKYHNRIILKNYKIEEVMTKRVVSVSSDDTIQTALEVFSDNLFHAVPVIEDNELVGIVTTHDIVFRLLHPKNVSV